MSTEESADVSFERATTGGRAGGRDDGESVTGEAIEAIESDSGFFVFFLGAGPTSLLEGPLAGIRFEDVTK
jgi:hypothetical protein